MVMGILAATAVAAARWQGLVLDIPPRMIVYFVLYYVLGFLLITSILAAIGSVCNTLKDAQSLIMPIMLLLILPMVSWPNILQDPNGAWSRVLSFVPLTAPMVMILRLASGQSIAVVEILASLAILGASVPAAIWAGGRIFRTGILLYGKRPSLIEMVHWLRSR
jgi:ABC-2 type transport system permease protein